MDLSRREFFKLSAGTVTGTAIGGSACLGASLAPTLALAQTLRMEKAKATPSVCPYCSVGCATLVHTVGDKIVNIEGDPLFFQAEDGIRHWSVTGVQTCALPISHNGRIKKTIPGARVFFTYGITLHHSW